MGFALRALKTIKTYTSSGDITDTATDESISRVAHLLRDTDRRKLATRDANLNFPEAAGIFSCALGAPISEKDTPYVYQILRREASDAGYAGDGAKEMYKRNRPFVVNKQPACTPEEMNRLGADRSYPSGHASTGTAWALILAKLGPDRAGPLLRRGQAFAESRVVCNMHWQSDTMQGRFVGAYPAIELRARQEGAEIHWGDETALVNTDVRARSYAPAG